MITLTQWERHSAWGFSFAVKQFASQRQYVRPAEVMHAIGCSYLEAVLALNFLVETGYMGKRNSDGRFYIQPEEKRKQIQEDLTKVRW